MKWNEAGGYIFDVDGTLYPQKKVRVNMALRLTKYYLIRPFKWKEVAAIYYFRKLRENEKYKSQPMEYLYKNISLRLGVPEKAIFETIHRWMFTEPLDLLKKYRYTEITDFIIKKYNEGTKIIIYSDYPALDKLKAMGIKYNSVYTSCDESIQEQKPSERAMKKILQDIKIPPEKIIYIGDRDEKDKKSAEIIGIKYYDIDEFRNIISACSTTSGKQTAAGTGRQ